MTNFLYSLLDMTEDEATIAIKNKYGDMHTLIVFREPNFILSLTDRIKVPSRLELYLCHDKNNLHRVHTVLRYENYVLLEKSSKSTEFEDLPEYVPNRFLLELVKNSVINCIKNNVVYNEPWKCDKNGYDSVKICKELGFVEDLLQKGFPHLKYYNIRSHSANPDIAKLFSSVISSKMNRLLYDIYSRMRIKQSDGKIIYEFIYGSKTFEFYNDTSSVEKDYILQAFNDLVTINKMY